MTYMGCRPATTVYQIEGASYDGCNGWTTWICNDFMTTDENEAHRACAELNKQQYNRYSVISKTIT